MSKSYLKVYKNTQVDLKVLSVSSKWGYDLPDRYWEHVTCIIMNN